MIHERTRHVGNRETPVRPRTPSTFPHGMGRKAGILTEPTARCSWSMVSTATARHTPKRRGRTTGDPSYIQRAGDFFLPDGTDIPVGRVQLLPDACIVKIPDRDYWSEDVQELTTRIVGVYALDRRQHFHLCELCASYELWFIEHQYEPVEGRTTTSGRSYTN